MSEHILFLTGKLAEKQLRQILEKMQPEFSYTVHQIGVKVAALMTADMIGRRLKDTFNADRIIIPGRCRGDIEELSKTLSVPVERGPDELKDLPLYFGKQALHIDLTHYDVKIFAEIVDAPNLAIEEVVQRAYYYQNNGANIIDIGCLPDTPFAHMEDIIRALKLEGFKVSIDSLETADLLRGAKAGADYMLSLHESTLWVADEVDAIPVIIPEKHTDIGSLDRAITLLQNKNKAFIVDPILDPIHFGFTESVVRYHTVRQKHPEIEMMLGVGNITELTHADTAGMNAILLGMCSELNIKQILATEVSQHAGRAIKEADVARRIMYAAKENNTLPKHINPDLMALHETSPFPYQLAEIKEFAAQVRDPSFRIQISTEGVHIYNRDGFHSAIDPFDLYPKLQVENDAGHAFYLGVELARAETAWQLGKRFNQDQSLDWGCAAKTSEQTVDLHTFKPAGTTFKKS
ncbi:dihydropteroate synthase [Methylococcaceae bacterium HT4]|nr:dihydropteroate synthase [Methyloprofundus sp.]TXK96419.1 dihydropteroate synthase [Methylococcaceae bacterium CS4]TXK97091.1 dihydropteroate synthase [Methylococcaceae bacterium CS5]TXL06033.1 dihydropteroate synthase [Methylococcaceae bacterium CS3]TXL06359.1 dihydropteroate synthase [Methylococcaceae bacterium CS1]TXL11621.1 dihydropteroate synthase [Methylococcaceae bacterium CS2]TXL14135.1 dihydropteroate synthase [Methylococcaceae bacterium HT4]TXL20059.1 dihydropteroate synthase [M